MSDNLAGSIANMAGVAVMGAVAMKTIDIVSNGSSMKTRKHKRRCKR